MDKKRRADGAHPEDPEREDGKWMRMEGNKRKTVEEEKREQVEENKEVLADVGQNRGEDGP